jgi:ribosomal protein S18 acetylase RimI-like enzyme
VIEYRSFLNTDPPLVAEIWNQQPTFRSQISRMNPELLEQHIFSKQYFDRHGMFLAVDRSGDQPKPLGFVHASFSVNEQLDDLDHSTGIVCQLKMVPNDRQQEVAAGLLNHACQYLTRQGATIAHVGGHFPRSPFYLGLYGGSRIPGVMAPDRVTLDAFLAAGFEPHDKICVLERSLTGFRTIVNRNQMKLRREYVISADGDPMERSWWESCTLGGADRDRFTIASKTSPQECGTVSYWDIEPMASQWGGPAKGLYDLAVSPDLQRTGLATFLVGESLRRLMQNGIGLVEAQARQSDEASMGVFHKLGFEQVAEGMLMRKSLA